MNHQELLLHQLFQTVRIITKGLNTTLEPYQLYSSEWSIMTTLKQTGPITQGALANYLNIEPPAVSRTLSVLEKKGFISRMPGIDKREKNVSLSDKSLAQYPEWLKASNQHRQAVLANLSSEQHTQLLTSLKIIFHDAQQFEESKQNTKERDDLLD